MYFPRRMGLSNRSQWSDNDLSLHSLLLGVAQTFANLKGAWVKVSLPSKAASFSNKSITRGASPPFDICLVGLSVTHSGKLVEFWPHIELSWSVFSGLVTQSS